MSESQSSAVAKSMAICFTAYVMTSTARARTSPFIQNLPKAARSGFVKLNTLVDQSFESKRSKATNLNQSEKPKQTDRTRLNRSQVALFTAIAHVARRRFPIKAQDASFTQKTRVIIDCSFMFSMSRKGPFDTSPLCGSWHDRAQVIEMFWQQGRDEITPR